MISEDLSVKTVLILSITCFCDTLKEFSALIPSLDSPPQWERIGSLYPSVFCPNILGHI